MLECSLPRGAFAVLSVAPLLLLAGLAGGCPAESHEGATSTLNRRRDAPASQDAALRAFVAVVERGEPAVLQLTDVTAEGDDIVYTLATRPADRGHTDARIVVDARKDRYWGRDPYRTYEVQGVAVTLTAAPVSRAEALTPDAGARERASVAVRASRDGRLLFDSSAGHPVTDAAAAWRK